MVEGIHAFKVPALRAKGSFCAMRSHVIKCTTAVTALRPFATSAVRGETRDFSTGFDQEVEFIGWSSLHGHGNKREMKTSIFITMNDYGTCDGPRDGEEKGRSFSLSVFHIPSDEAVVKH